MGAAFDLMCENEGLESRLSSKNRTIREQKKLITELAEGIVKHFKNDWAEGQKEEKDALWQKAEKILAKENKKKKK